jgi:hypothetical protein
VLTTAAVDAVIAERRQQRLPKRLDSGALVYRGPKPRRLSLTVTPSSGGRDKPQLVRVSVYDRRR